MSDMNFSAPNSKKTALVLDRKDNVGVALADLAANEVCTVTEDGGTQYEVTVVHDIPFGHKFALADLAKDEAVLKYGEEIGKMKESLTRGGWIHNHNMYCDRGMK
jgi:altronate dehydratase